MKIPALRGVIERRILVNYQVDPDVLAGILPNPFQPKLIGGLGMAGICLIRLAQLRPRFLPAVFGVTSENAAHRIAVEWIDDGRRHEGVYIPRRDTSSRFNTLVGGRLFPGTHHHASFVVEEHDDLYHVALDSDDGRAHVAFEGRLAAQLPPSSVFDSIAQAAEFFQRGSLGYSPTSNSRAFEGLELRTSEWRIQPLAVDRVESSYFDNRELFPPGSLAFDCALLMRQIEHEWCEKPLLCSEGAV